MLKTRLFMRRFLLLSFGVVFTTLLSAQSASTFFSTFDAERGNVLAPASGQAEGSERSAARFVVER